MPFQIFVKVTSSPKDLVKVLPRTVMFVLMSTRFQSCHSEFEAISFKKRQLKRFLVTQLLCLKWITGIQSVIFGKAINWVSRDRRENIMHDGGHNVHLDREKVLYCTAFDMSSYTTSDSQQWSIIKVHRLLTYDKTRNQY